MRNARRSGRFDLDRSWTREKPWEIVQGNKVVTGTAANPVAFPADDDFPGPPATKQEALLDVRRDFDVIHECFFLRCRRHAPDSMGRRLQEQIVELALTEARKAREPHAPHNGLMTDFAEVLVQEFNAEDVGLRRP